MGQDILWHEVKWEKLVAHGSPERRLKAVSRALWSPWRWLREFAISKEWRPLQESFNGLMFFNSDLESKAAPICERLHREFPVLVDIGVLWDLEKSCPRIPTDLPPDDGGHMMAAMSPERVVRILQRLKDVNRDLLSTLVQEAVDANAVDKIFESGEEFLAFVDATTEGLEKAAARGRGILVLLSY